MRFRRQKSALLLTGVLILGGLVAPLSHLVYMAVSDAHASALTHSGEDHHTMMPGFHWQASHEEHITCPYLELFATPLFGDTAQLAVAPSGDHHTALLHADSHVAWSPTLLFPYTVRGPPFFSLL